MAAIRPSPGKPIYSPLWQADGSRIRRYAPIEFIGRFLPHFFKFGIADEVHEAKAADTAQGNALGTLAAAVDKTIVLTGTLTGGMASDVFNVLYRIDPRRMVSQGYEYGEAGIRSFTETYGVLETITTIEPQENACSKAKVTKRVKERPGASPLLFGRFLMDIGAFVSLEDISANLPPYTEEVISVPMDKPLAEAYADLEQDIAAALQEHRGNSSVVSTALNALLLYPDRPFSIGPLWGVAYDEETKRRERFLIADPPDLDESVLYAKERRLVEMVQAEAKNRRAVQIYATYTQKRDVTRRLESVLNAAGIKAAVLTTQTPPEDREAWYERQLKAGVQAFIGHPRLVQTGLDLIFCPAIIWYQTGYSTFTLRQASRRSWRIGQTKPVTVRFLCYENTAQVGCLRLMGRKLLVSMAMEGKFSDSGLQAMDDGADVLTTLARELVMHQGVGQSADEVWRALQVQQPQSRTPEPIGAGTGGGTATDLRAAFCSLAGIWAGRAGGGRHGEESFQHLRRISFPCFDFAQLRRSFEDSGDATGHGKRLDLAFRTDSNPNWRARHLECAPSKDNTEVLWHVKHPYRYHRPLLRR